MVETTRSNASSPRKAIFTSLFFLLFGFAPLLKAADRPSWHAIPTTLVLRLVASGMCFGVSLAFMSLVVTRNR
jgi:hypothetical protein